MAAPIAIAQLIGSGVQSYGMRQTSRFEQAAYNARAMQSELDAAEFEAQAGLGRISAGMEEAKLRRKMGTLQGAQRASIAASGVLSTGSAAQLLAKSAEEQELEALMLRFNMENEVTGKQLSAQRARMNASNLRAEGRTARRQRSAGSSLNLLMGGIGAASTYSSLSQFNKVGK